MLKARRSYAPAHARALMPKRQPSTSTELFSWLHLSDIHLLQPPTSARAEQQLVFDALCSDLRLLVATGTAARAVLITGDIAYSGAGISADEYKRAGLLVGSIQQLLGIDTNATF